MNITKTNWFTKFVECLLVAIAFINTASMVLEFLPQSWFQKLGNNFDTIFFSAEYGIGLLFGIVYSIYWHKKEKKDATISGRKHAWMLGIIRYWLAFEISTYGFAKILGTQFHTPSYRKDMLLGEANGFALTWYYYGYSYTLAVIIACTQIGGSILLLFRRTVLLGATILLPVLINILLINVFFDIASGAFANSVIFTIGLFFLFAMHWQLVKKVFVELKDGLPPLKFGFFKPILKLLPIVLAFAFIEYLIKNDESDKKLVGVWQVKQMVKNKDTVTAISWLTDTSSFKKVYF